MSPRSKQFRKIISPPVLKGFMPIGVPFNDAGVVSLLYEEYEALRLADYSGLKQEEAARLMNVSRPTFTRIYSSCLQKLAKAFTEGRSIVIEGGDVEFDKQWYRCNSCTTVYHHPEEEHNQCINCSSVDIEHINQSVRDWRLEKSAIRNVVDPDEYCICASCSYEIPHQQGIPCFSNTCPDCKTTMIRKSD